MQCVTYRIKCLQGSGRVCPDTRSKVGSASCSCQLCVSSKNCVVFPCSIDISVENRTMAVWETIGQALGRHRHQSWREPGWRGETAGPGIKSGTVLGGGAVHVGVVRCTTALRKTLHRRYFVFNSHVCHSLAQGCRVREHSFKMVYQRPFFVIVMTNATRRRTAGVRGHTPAVPRCARSHLAHTSERDLYGFTRDLWCIRNLHI